MNQSVSHQSRFDEAASLFTDHGMSRAAAATLLRDIRHACSAGATQEVIDELIDWAHLAMPDRVTAQRLKIQRLLDESNLEEASTFIARALLQRPNHRALLKLRAHCLFLQQRFASAQKEICRALHQRPNHISTLVLAADIAMACEHAPDAVALLERALARSPMNTELRVRLAEGFQHANRPQDALDVLLQLEDPPAMLLARTLASLNRTRDAIDILEAELRALHSCEPAEYRDDLLAELNVIAEPISSYESISEITARINDSTPYAQIAAAFAFLRYGKFTESLRLALRVIRRHANSAASHIALHCASVAAILTQRNRLAEILIDRMRTHKHGIDAMRMSEIWRRALIGSVLNQQPTHNTTSERCETTASTSEANDHMRVLSPLLDDAIVRFRSQVAPASATSARPKADTSTHARLHRNIALCEIARGRSERALTAFSHALASLQQDDEMTEPNPSILPPLTPQSNA